MSARITVTDEMRVRAAKAMADDWNPERDPILTAMFRDYAASALEAAAPLIAAQALKDAADRLDLTGLERNSELSRWDYDSSDFYEELVAEWLTAQARADQIEAGR